MDAKNWSGRLDRRDVGGWFRADVRLFVGDRDRSPAADGLARQVHAVHDALADAGLAPPVIPALCLVGAEWPWLSGPFRLRGVWVTRPASLARLIGRGAPLPAEQLLTVARALDARLPPM